jgi:hypothetical protein
MAERLSADPAQIDSLVKQVETTHQDFLWSSVRYDRYKIIEDVQEWLSRLGADVLLATHPHVIARLAKEFVAGNRALGMKVSDKEALLLELAAKTHDWGEIMIASEGVGDVTYDQKTPEIEEVEKSIFDQLIKDFPEGPEKELIKQAYYEVAMNRESELGQMFNAIERIGYLQTALRAYRGSAGKRISNWKGLVGNTFSSQIEVLIEYAKQYPYVKQVLIWSKKELDQAFAELINIDEIPLDKEDEPTYEQAKLAHQYEVWQQYSSDLL